MRILAILPRGNASQAILEHLGLPIELPRLAHWLHPIGRFEDA